MKFFIDLSKVACEYDFVAWDPENRLLSAGAKGFQKFSSSKNVPDSRAFEFIQKAISGDRSANKLLFSNKGVFSGNAVRKIHVTDSGSINVIILSSLNGDDVYEELNAKDLRRESMFESKSQNEVTLGHISESGRSYGW